MDPKNRCTQPGEASRSLLEAYGTLQKIAILNE